MALPPGNANMNCSEIDYSRYSGYRLLGFARPVLESNEKGDI
jgi:hypothetical protein